MYIVRLVQKPNISTEYVFILYVIIHSIHFTVIRYQSIEQIILDFSRMIHFTLIKIYFITICAKVGKNSD